MKKLKLFMLSLICFAATTLNAAVHTINTGSYYYTPSSLSINLGDTVEWVNDGGNHDVNADIDSQTGLSFNNPVAFQSNATNTVGAIIYTHVFDVAGIYNYDCSIGSHAAAGMVGSVTVSNSNTIFDIVSNSNDHNTLEAAIDACDLDVTLSGPGPFTLFAPTDAAFDLLPAGTVAALLNDIPQLSSILLHHTVQGSVMSGMLSNNQIVTTVNGTDVTVTINSTGVFIDDALVSFADIPADNGVVHVLDAVLLPPSDCAGIFNGISSTDSCGTCHQSYMYAGMGSLTFVDTYSDTVGLSGTFVLAGSPIDVMSNPNWISDAALCPNTIYDVVSNSNNHTTLKAAVDACDLDETLSGPGPFTLFAPTDAAFDLLPAGTVTALLNDLPQLTSILLHHVISDSVTSDMLSNGQVVTTANGTDVTVTINSTGVFIDDAQVTVADILADNGVVHVIDAVLLPPVTSVQESNLISEPKFLYSLNILGVRVEKYNSNQLVLDVYSDGSIIKRFIQ